MNSTEGYEMKLSQFSQILTLKVQMVFTAMDSTAFD